MISLAIVAWEKGFYSVVCKFESSTIKEENICLSQDGTARSSSEGWSTASVCACSPEMAVGVHPLLRGSRSGGAESRMNPEQLDLQRHRQSTGQLVCKTAEAPDFNCSGGLLGYCVGSSFKSGFSFADPWILNEQWFGFPHGYWQPRDKEKKGPLDFSPVSWSVSPCSHLLGDPESAIIGSHPVSLVPACEVFCSENLHTCLLATCSSSQGSHHAENNIS